MGVYDGWPADETLVDGRALVQSAIEISPSASD